MSSCGCCCYYVQRQLEKLLFTNNNEELRNSTDPRRDYPSYTASQPTVALKEYVVILSGSPSQESAGQVKKKKKLKIEKEVLQIVF